MGLDHISWWNKVSPVCNAHHSRYLLYLISSDLGYDKEPDDIYRGLQDSWNIALSSGAKVLALTIPEAAARSKILIERRTKLNNLILSHEVERLWVFFLIQGNEYTAPFLTYSQPFF